MPQDDSGGDSDIHQATTTATTTTATANTVVGMVSHGNNHNNNKTMKTESEMAFAYLSKAPFCMVLLEYRSSNSSSSSSSSSSHKEEEDTNNKNKKNNNSGGSGDAATTTRTTTTRILQTNETFVQNVGPLFKLIQSDFVNLFTEGDSRDRFLQALQDCVTATTSTAAATTTATSKEPKDLPEESISVKVQNVEMLTVTDKNAGFPIRKHFDWTITAEPRNECDDSSLSDPNNNSNSSNSSLQQRLLLFGEPCHPDNHNNNNNNKENDDTNQNGQSPSSSIYRPADAELIDFFQNAPIALHWLNGEGNVLWANQTEMNLLGYTAAEYIGQPIMKFCPDETELVLEIFKQLGSGNSIRDVPVRFRAKDGRIVDLLIDSNVKYDAAGRFEHTRCFIRDDTQRKIKDAKAQLLLQETKRSLQMLDHFMSRTLHHMRTPLHVLQNTVELVSSKLLHMISTNPVLPPSTNGSRSASPSMEARMHQHHHQEDDDDMAAAMMLHLNQQQQQQQQDPYLLESQLQLQYGSLHTSHDVDDDTNGKEECLALLLDANEHLNSAMNLIDDVQDLARFDQGAEFQLRLEKVHLAQLAQEVLESVLSQQSQQQQHVHFSSQQQSTQKQVSLHVELEGAVHGGGPAYICTDRRAITKVLKHLLDNAVMACSNNNNNNTASASAGTTASRRVALRVHYDESGRCKFVVQDNGPGIHGMEEQQECTYDTPALSSLCSNDGCSKPTPRLPRIFQRYHQEALPDDDGVVDWNTADTLRRNIEMGVSSHRKNGIGIGLSLSYYLVQALGGDLRYSSQPGILTQFWFSLPTGMEVHEHQGIPKLESFQHALQPFGNDYYHDQHNNHNNNKMLHLPSESQQIQQQQQQQHSKNQPTIVPPTIQQQQQQRQEEDIVPSTFTEPRVEPAKDTPKDRIAQMGVAAMDNPTVLVVDDTLTCTKLLCRHLQNLNCTTDTAENGLVAIEKLKAAPPGMYNLILMDIRMPVMDGIEATRIIKQELACWKHVPVVALTGEGGEGIRKECNDVGFDAFHSKPLKKDQLKEILELFT